MIRKPHWRISIRALDFERSSHTQNRKRMIFSLRRVILCLSEYCSPRIDLKIYSIFIYNIIFIICIIHYHFYYQFSNLIPSFFFDIKLIDWIIDWSFHLNHNEIVRDEVSDSEGESGLRERERETNSNEKKRKLCLFKSVFFWKTLNQINQFWVYFNDLSQRSKQSISIYTASLSKQDDNYN